MNDPLISVIIPVYNVEKYLNKCLNSVINQTYSNLEIILIDDGSSDTSGKICDEYAMKDSRIRVVHKNNGGLSSARNTGMKVMNGDYFSFIDSDDYVAFDYIYCMYLYMLKDNSDIVICSFKKIYGNQSYSDNKNSYKHFKFDRETVKFKMLSRQVPMYAPGKLYRADLAVNMEFPEGKLYEDMPTTWNIIKKITNVTYITKELYFYRQRRDSIVNLQYKPQRMDQLYFAEQILSEIEGNNRLYHTAASLCFFAASDNYAMVTDEFPDNKKYCENAIKKYSKSVIMDTNTSIPLKIMALSAQVSPRFVRIIGKTYKKYFEWKKY